MTPQQRRWMKREIATLTRIRYCYGAECEGCRLDQRLITSLVRRAMMMQTPKKGRAK